MKKLIPILAFIAINSSALASEIELYCGIKGRQDAPAWKVHFVGEQATIYPNDFFPKGVQEGKAAIVLQSGSTNKPIPLASYSGKTSEGASVVFKITSLDLTNSMAWPNTNFYEGYIGLSEGRAEYVRLTCTGPKIGVSF